MEMVWGDGPLNAFQDPFSGKPASPAAGADHPDAYHHEYGQRTAVDLPGFLASPLVWSQLEDTPDDSLARFLRAVGRCHPITRRLSESQQPTRGGSDRYCNAQFDRAGAAFYYGHNACSDGKRTNQYTCGNNWTDRGS